MRPRTDGLIAAPHTPMHPDGSIHLETVEQQAALLVRNGVLGAFVCGTTGESLSLTPGERMSVVERWVGARPPGFRVIAHVGTTDLATARSLAAHAQAVGADAVAAMAPPFFRPGSLDDLVSFTARVAESAPSLPFYYYHIPAFTGVTFPVREFLAVAEPRIENLAGAKFTCGDLEDLALSLDRFGDHLDLLFGLDELLLCALALGVRGAIGGTYNFAAPLHQRIIAAFRGGRMDDARRLQVKSMEVVRFLSSASGGFAPAAKAVMGLIGVDCGPVRPPLRAATRDDVRRIAEGLGGLGFDEFRCR